MLWVISMIISLQKIRGFPGLYGQKTLTRTAYLVIYPRQKEDPKWTLPNVQNRIFPRENVVIR